MSVSIIACPKCNTLLLSDTAQCPSCRHVLDPQRAAAAPMPATQKSDPLSDDHEICPACGEEVRKGLVRCFNCGTFMREEIAQTYQRMKDSPQEIIYSPVPQENKDEPGSDAETYVIDDDDDEDFELAPEVMADFDAAGFDDEEFNVAPEMKVERADDDFDDGAGEIEDGTYGLLAQAPSIHEPPAKTAEQIQAEVNAAKAAADEAAAREAEAEKARQRPEGWMDDLNGEAHSVATGGDVLLKVALEEEAERGRRRSEIAQRRGEGGTAMTGILVYCPNGHRIEVPERHRGKTGRCPRCRESFFVPKGPWVEEEAPQQTQKQKDAEADRQIPSDKPYVVAAGEYSYWLEDVHYHTIDLQKLKIKAGSVEKAFEPIDLAFAPFGMLLMKLVKKGGLFSASKQSPDDVRDLAREHLSDEKPLDQLPVPFHQLIDAEEVKQLRVVQPAPSDYESMFAGVPIFGQGRIAVRFAKGESETTRTFASFSLSEFRIFVVILSDLFGMKDFAADCDIPLVNSFTELKCHYSGQPVKALDQLDYYKADSEFMLKVVGRKCAECGIVVSEEARAKEKLGGANGKAIAKAKCPKCAKKFGDISLYGIEKGPAIGWTGEEHAAAPSGEHAEA